MQFDLFCKFPISEEYKREGCHIFTMKVTLLYYLHYDGRTSTLRKEQIHYA